MRLDDRIAFRVERDGADRRPIASSAGPACRIELAGLGVQRMPRRQNRVIFPGMPLRRADVANAAVPMLEVVPTHEVVGPGASIVDSGEAFDRKLRPVLRRAEQGLSINTVQIENLRA